MLCRIVQIIGVEDEEREGSRDRRKVKYVDVTHQTVVKRHGCGKAGAMPTSGSQETVSTRYLEMVGMQWLPLDAPVKDRLLRWEREEVAPEVDDMDAMCVQVRPGTCSFEVGEQ